MCIILYSVKIKTTRTETRRPNADNVQVCKFIFLLLRQKIMILRYAAELDSKTALGVRFGTKLAN